MLNEESLNACSMYSNPVCVSYLMWWIRFLGFCLFLCVSYCTDATDVLPVDGIEMELVTSFLLPVSSGRNDWNLISARGTAGNGSPARSLVCTGCTVTLSWVIAAEVGYWQWGCKRSNPQGWTGYPPATVHTSAGPPGTCLRISALTATEGPEIAFALSCLPK